MIVIQIDRQFDDFQLRWLDIEGMSARETLSDLFSSPLHIANWSYASFSDMINDYCLQTLAGLRDQVEKKTYLIADVEPRYLPFNCARIDVVNWSRAISDANPVLVLGAGSAQPCGEGESGNILIKQLSQILAFFQGSGTTSL